MCPIEEMASYDVFVLNSKNTSCREKSFGNQRGERCRASSPERRGQRQTRQHLLGGHHSWDLLGRWAGAALKPHAGNSDGHTAIELLSEVVTWLVLVWFGRQRGMKSWVFDGLYFFKAPWTVFSVLGAVGGCRVLRCGRSGGPPPRD